MRYLAIDHGGKRTGLAICDAGETICSPLEVLATAGDLAERVAAVVKCEEIEGVVIGLPLNMDGSEGESVKRVRKFGEQLAEQVDIPIEYHDERLSSFDAESRFIGAELTRKKKKKRLDAVAAAAILEAFLEFKHQ